MQHIRRCLSSIHDNNPSDDVVLMIPQDLIGLEHGPSRGHDVFEKNDRCALTERWTFDEAFGPVILRGGSDVEDIQHQTWSYESGQVTTT